jgi:hypothetical protein
MNRRRLAATAVVALLSPAAAIVRAQPIQGDGCTLSFVNGMLRFGPECTSLDVAGLPFDVAPPSHLVSPPVTTTTGVTVSTRETRAERLLTERERRDAKKNRRRVRRRRNKDQRRARREAAKPTPTPTPTPSPTPAPTATRTPTPTPVPR